MRRSRMFGFAAEFETPEQILNAAKRVREAGYKRVDAYTPFPIHGLSDNLGFKDERVPLAMFIAGAVGAAFGFFMQSYTNAFDYPVNVGGRPLIGYPAFIPVMFECTVLFSALTGAIGMFAMNGLPKPYDPMFNLDGFERASQDRFFLCVEASDANFDPEETERLLSTLNPVSVQAVAK